MTCRVVLLVVVLLLAGCSVPERQVVVKPDQAATLNSTEWTVKSQPRAAEAQGKGAR